MPILNELQNINEKAHLRSDENKQTEKRKPPHNKEDIEKNNKHFFFFVRG